MDPKDLNLYVEVSPRSSAQGDAPEQDSGAAMADAVAALTTAAAALSRSVGGPASAVSTEPKALSFGTKQRIHASLQRTLTEELAKEGATLGLRPGELVAISSSVGQSISF